MFASSRVPTPRRHYALSWGGGAGEGRDCEAARHATVAVLLPQGQVGAWVLLLAGCCTWVVVQTVLLRLS